MEFAKGDTVKVICFHPHHGWGKVRRGDTGVVEYVHSSGEVTINFKAQSMWNAEPGEIELVEAFPNGQNRDLGRRKREW